MSTCDDRFIAKSFYDLTMKQPTLTKSARGSSSDNKGRLVAPRDDGKSPRGQY